MCCVPFRCIVPQITVMSPILNYRRCFLRHPYEQNVTFQNDTDLPARYELLPQHMDETVPILYTSPKPKGIIPPNKMIQVPLVITPQAIGNISVSVLFMIFGSPDPPLVSPVVTLRRQSNFIRSNQAANQYTRYVIALELI